MIEPEEPHQAGVFITWPIALALLFALLLAFVVGGWRLNAIQQDYTNQIAASALKVACVTGNEFRSRDKDRWDSIVLLFGPPPHSADIQNVIDSINAQTSTADVLRDCRHLTPTAPPPILATTVPKSR